jgi:hypothetical protein
VCGFTAAGSIVDRVKRAHGIGKDLALYLQRAPDPA